jgi:hypothetical protein
MFEQKNGDQRMLRRLANIGFLMLFLCWVVGFGLTVWHSSENPKSPQQHNSREAPKEKNQKDITDERLANYTLLLAWFTGVLAVSTIGLWIVTWRSGIRQSRDMEASIAAAHRTADIAEKALLSVEIPYLYPFIREHGFRIGISARSGQRGVIDLDFGLEFIKYYFRNFGRTPAEIIEVQSILLPSMGMPNPYPVGPRNINPLSGHIVAADGGESQDILYSFSKGMFETLSQGKFNLDTHTFWFFGFVRYNDVFENEYVRGFCLGYSPMTDSFYPVGGDGYNYRKKTKSAGQAAILC